MSRDEDIEYNEVWLVFQRVKKRNQSWFKLRVKGETSEAGSYLSWVLCGFVHRRLTVDLALGMDILAQ